jgi:diketogulonate reductase-like aldo/keto reductase
VDLLLVHAPIDVANREDHWKALELIKQEGYAKSIGLAYMNNVQLSDFIKNCTIIPAVLELEFSPFGQNEEVVEFCVDNGIALLVDELGEEHVYCTTLYYTILYYRVKYCAL